MKRIAALAMLAVSSCSATLIVRGTAPTQTDASATCAGPRVLAPATAPALWMHAAIVGRAGEDSVSVAPGAPFTFTWALPAGTYQVRAWASAAARPDVVGCDTTITRTTVDRPDRPRINP